MYFKNFTTIKVET